MSAFTKWVHFPTFLSFTLTRTEIISIHTKDKNKGTSVKINA